MDQFGEHPEEIMGILELDPLLEDQYNLFFVINDLERSYYYTLIMNVDNTYDLTEITTSANSWVNSYGKSAYCSVSIYEIAVKDIDYDEITEILISVEVQGMTEADNGDGTKPFKKVQHDIISIKNGILAQDNKYTAEFNEKYGIKINEDSDFGVHEFLQHKYYSTISNDFEHEKMEMLLDDIGVLTKNSTSLQHEFQPVRKLDNDEYVVDLGYNFYECYFIPYSNNFQTHELDHFDYPIFYVQGHGVYLYSIIRIKTDDDLILLTLEKIYHQDENTEEYNMEPDTNIDITLQNISGKWVLKYKSNPLMMEKHSKDLEVVNSNEGQ